MEKIFEQIPLAAEYQKIIGILTIIIATVIAANVIRLILFVVIKRITKVTKTELDDLILDAIRYQIYWLIYLFGISILFNYIQTIWAELLGFKLFEIVDGIIYGIGVFLVSSIIIKFISAILSWYGTHIASKTETQFDDEFVPLIDRVSKITIYLLALLIVLDHFKVDIKGLLAVLGVGSLAIALAAKDTISNMIGGFILMVDRPFRIGDWVQLVDGTTCIVKQIGVRSTKFLTFDNTYIITPNAELINSTIHNLTYPYPQFRISVDVGVGYDSDIKKVARVMIEEAQAHEKVLSQPEPYFSFLNFGDSSLDVSLRCRISNVEDKYTTTSELREKIMERFRKENIEIPFPQRVVTHINANDKNKP